MKRKSINWALVILWMALIFAFSHQPATESNQLSSGITKTIEDTIKMAIPNIDVDQWDLNHIIRKCAHFGVYLILGVLVANGLIDAGISKTKGICLSLIVCVLYAISDELHQLYIPGRSGQVSDVILDSAGGLVGILVLNAVRRKSS